MALFNIQEDPNEEWRDIKGFEDYYQVSNLGRVRGKQRVATDGKKISGKLLKTTGTLYKSASLWKGGKGYNKMVHRLVAEAFLPNPDNLPEVNHKDKNPANNVVSNLEWVTVTDNNAHKNANRRNQPYRRSVRCLETGEIFSSISAAGRSVQADATQVVESIEAQRCCKGMTFAYEDALPEDIDSYVENAHAKYQDFHKRPRMKNSRKVQAVETGDVFDSIAAASRFYNCDTGTIRNRINAAKPFNGITLKYVEEVTEK